VSERRFGNPLSGQPRASRLAHQALPRTWCVDQAQDLSCESSACHRPLQVFRINRVPCFNRIGGGLPPTTVHVGRAHGRAKREAFNPTGNPTRPATSTGGGTRAPPSPERLQASTPRHSLTVRPHQHAAGVRPHQIAVGPPDGRSRNIPGCSLTFDRTASQLVSEPQEFRCEGYQVL
jgi:hypothetical protein